ncbi:hypothetical protein OB905_01440 [Halobacteria archaeon AArc-dxtr1]|nr:hypothetical protein [Halobacteria archaeon AArc-dxtr1]
MRVIRQSTVLGQTTHRRLVGTVAASTAAILESVAVYSWFLLLVLSTRTPSTALVGLGILVVGCVLRTGVFGIFVGAVDELLQPGRVALAVFLAAGWVSWLFVAESIGGAAGVVVAGLILVAGLTAQFWLEPRIVGIQTKRGGVLPMLLPATLLALAASMLLSSVWFVEWAVLVTPLGLDPETFTLELEAIHLAGAGFVLVAFAAHRCRFRRTVP